MRLKSYSHENENSIAIAEIECQCAFGAVQAGENLETVPISSMHRKELFCYIFIALQQARRFTLT